MSQSNTSRILSGIQPTRHLTLGNYYGAIRNWLALGAQQEKMRQDQRLFCIVDLHALTVPQDPQKLRHATLLTAATYVACGLEPRDNILFVQSHVPAHSELAWLLSCVTPMGWLSRMTQFKDKAGKAKDKAALGLYSYPVLMAADILLYDTTHVPVGEDQKQHIELARDIALSINARFGEDLLTVPTPVIQEFGARIMSLRDGTQKMSKSDPSDFSRIHLTDDNDVIAQKIRKAKTDPEPLPDNFAALQDRPEAKNLVTLYALATRQSAENVLQHHAGAQFSDFKPQLTEALCAEISPIRDALTQLMASPRYLTKLLTEGAQQAASIATPKLQQIKDSFGLAAASWSHLEG